MKFKPKYCKFEGKFCYSSESKSLRAKVRYNDIKRTYYCEHCESWHTTSQVYKGVPKEVVLPTQSEIHKRLKFLMDKVEKENNK
jgi:transcriptional regulator NrdR family protein